MKILFLSRRFYPDNGGVEKHVYKISKELIQKGHEVTVLTQSEGEFNHFEKIKIVRLLKTPKNSSEKIHIWKCLWKNRILIKDSAVIHAHDVYFWYWPFKFIFLSKKSYITFHGYESYPISKKAIIFRKISEILADGNIIVGDFIKKWYHTKPNFVIYGGVDLSKKTHFPKERNSAVFIGRLDEHTGILDFVKAVEIVKKDFKNFELEILGEGRYFDKLKKYKPQGFKENIDDYLVQNHFAFVSRYLSILEALANRRLVFALFDNQVKEDYLRMSPFAKYIIIENTPEKLAEKVIYFLNDESKTNKLISEGYDWVKDQTWEKVANIYLKLWRK